MLYQYQFQTTINIQNEDGVDTEFMPAMREFEIHEKNNAGDSEFTPEFISEGELPEKMI